MRYAPPGLPNLNLNAEILIMQATTLLWVHRISFRRFAHVLTCQIVHREHSHSGVYFFFLKICSVSNFSVGKVTLRQPAACRLAQCDFYMAVPQSDHTGGRKNGAVAPLCPQAPRILDPSRLILREGFVVRSRQ